MNKYEIDISHDYPLEEIVKSFNEYGLTLEKYIRVGPGGGNQNVIISATSGTWAAWCLKNYSEDPESHRIK